MAENISDFERCQIHTPPEIVAVFWKIVRQHRSETDRIIDMGAGDGRFAIGGRYNSYEGFEIDKHWQPISNFPRKARIKYQCVFASRSDSFDACIGNPPYVRHHNIEKTWRATIKEKINSKLKISLNELCNLFVYFICLGIIKTKPDGIVAFIVPYEWVSRPSTKALREYIQSQGWGVHVYRFKEEIFDKVLTTASITVINKAEAACEWKYYDIDQYFHVTPKNKASGTRYTVLPYENRDDVWALRGLSPGTQKVFTLSEGERLHHGLKLSDVIPCITSLRDVPQEITILNKAFYKKYFIKTGAKCWLIRSDRRNTISDSLKSYLSSIPKNERDTWTCNDRTPWYAYPPHPAPVILYSSGFTSFGPKFLINKIGAIAIGSVHGIHTSVRLNKKALREYLSVINFEKRVVAHSGVLKKVEVRQMNGILSKYLNEGK